LQAEDHKETNAPRARLGEPGRGPARTVSVPDTCLNTAWGRCAVCKSVTWKLQCSRYRTACSVCANRRRPERVGDAHSGYVRASIKYRCHQVIELAGTGRFPPRQLLGIRSGDVRVTFGESLVKRGDARGVRTSKVREGGIGHLAVADDPGDRDVVMHSRRHLDAVSGA
jgi:hypothetical protein